MNKKIVASEDSGLWHKFGYLSEFNWEESAQIQLDWHEFVNK